MRRLLIFLATILVASLVAVAGIATNSGAVSARIADTTTGTTTTPAVSGLPPPYNKAPSIGPIIQTTPTHLSRSSVRTFVMNMTWQGNAKVTRLYLVKLPIGWSLLKIGSTPFRSVKGQPYWLITGVHGTVYKLVKLHIRLSLRAPVGRAYFIFRQRSQNGRLVEDLTWHRYFWVYK